MAETSTRPPVRGGIQQLTDEDLEGFTLQDVNCRGCSGYGNCGFRSYRLYNGKAVSLCIARMDELKEGQASS